jgi:hypothetical protein
MYPNDPAGEAGEVINCRCLSLPVFDGVSPDAIEEQAKPDITKLIGDALAPIVEELKKVNTKNAELEAALKMKPEPVINVTTPDVKLDVHIDNTAKPMQEKTVWVLNDNGDPVESITTRGNGNGK